VLRDQASPDRESARDDFRRVTQQFEFTGVLKVPRRFPIRSPTFLRRQELTLSLGGSYKPDIDDGGGAAGFWALVD
jgi:hypothetical protein